MELNKLSEHIYRIEEKGGPLFVSCWLVVDHDDVYIIDTMFPGFGPQILKQAQQLGNVKAIILTHAHLDHIGNVKYLLEHVDVPVYANELDIPYITGKKQFTVAKDDETKNIVIKKEQITALKNDNGDYTMIGPLKPYAVYGHTLGNMVFYHQEDDLLIGGDMFDFQDDKLISLHPRFSSDFEQSKINAVNVLETIAPKYLSLTHSPKLIQNPLNYLDAYKQEFLNTND